jgi:hypothetical protein
MRFFAFLSVLFAFIAALGALVTWSVVSLDQSSFNADQRTILHLVTLLAFCAALFAPLFSVLFAFESVRLFKVSSKRKRGARRLARRGLTSAW